MRKINKIKNLSGLLDLASIPLYLNGGQYSAGNLVRSIKRITKREDYLGKPEHNYDFTQSEEWANLHGYYPDERGHRDDRVKKESHPTHPSRGVWKSPYQFDLTDRGVLNVNYTLYGLNDGGQDPQATMTYRGGTVIPEITVTPAGNYIYNSYDNIRIIPEYKESGIHKYLNGGELENKIQNNKNYFIENWLNLRRQILARNATNNRFYDFVRYIFGNEKSVAQDEINRQMQNLNSVNEFEMSTNPTLFKSSFSDKQNRKHLEDIYNHYVDRENNTSALTNDDLSNLYIFFKGTYSPKNHTINYEENPKNNVIIHERTHSLKAFPQESTIHLLKYDDPGAFFMKGDFGNIYNEGVEKNSYLDDASEIYSRLMEFRYMNKLDPKKIYNKSDILRMRNNNATYDPNILNRYNDDYVERLLNKVAYNTTNNESQLLAVNDSNYSEGGIYIKKKNRGKFTKSAKQHGMGVLEYARKVVNDPNATTLLKRRALFAINAKKFKH